MIHEETKKVMLQACVNILSELSLTKDDVYFIMDEIDLSERAIEGILEHASKENIIKIVDKLKARIS